VPGQEGPWLTRTLGGVLNLNVRSRRCQTSTSPQHADAILSGTSDTRTAAMLVSALHPCYAGSGTDTHKGWEEQSERCIRNESTVSLVRHFFSPLNRDILALRRWLSVTKSP
jgi:hypothetical protein